MLFSFLFHVSIQTYIALSKAPFPSFPLMWDFNFHFWALVHWLLQDAYTVCKIHQKTRETESIKAMSSNFPACKLSQKNIIPMIKHLIRVQINLSYVIFLIDTSLIDVLSTRTHVLVMQAKIKWIMRKTTWRATEQATYQFSQIFFLPRGFTVPAQGIR